MAKSKDFGVAYGPDRHELTASLWDAKKRKGCLTASFCVFILGGDCIRYNMEVESIQNADDHGIWFNIEGYAMPAAKLRPGSGVYEAFVEENPDSKILHMRPHRVILRYNQSEKEGTINFFS